MVIKLLLFVSAGVSFIYFMSPDSFSFVESGDVLGIESRNATFNKPTLDTVLLAYCINEGMLPENLNVLYDGYLREERKLDLDQLYNYTIISSGECKYKLAF
jgi:hypothetical protein